MTAGDFSFFRAEIGSAYYIFVVHNNELDFGQCLCCWEQYHERIAKAITKSGDFRIKDVVFCGTYSKYNEKLGITETFSDMSDESRDHVKKLIIKVAPKAIEILRREEKARKETYIAEKLVKEYRYGDAKEHCRIFELNYDSIISNCVRR